MGGKRRGNNKGSENKRVRSENDNSAWKTFVYENAKFDAYYKLQNIVPEGEWDEFIAALKRPLPTTFRVTEGTEFEEEIKARLFKYNAKGNITLDDGTVVEPPRLLEWYPNNGGWYYNISRKDLKTNKEAKEFTTFLQNQTQCGYISRQEAVSMIPPMFLQVESHHRVLDMCAAPGSKTSQIIEFLHRDVKNNIPSGCVVANDADYKRCYTLMHQIQRYQTPCIMVTNQEAQRFPYLKSLPEDGNAPKEGVTNEGKVTFQFDRVLADVPCSGDGTLRKNPDIWGEWGVGKSLGLHRLQTQIAMRGVNLLKAGGRMVYSTCSMSPVENEAVVCEILRQSNGNVRLVDVSKELPNLKRNPGLNTWKVQDNTGKLYEKYEDITHEPTKKKVFPSVFPPTEEEVAKFNLQHCLRMLPHQQDTGGFFVAVLEKTSPTWKSILPEGTVPEKKEEVKSEETKTDSKEGELKEGEGKEEKKEEQKEGGKGGKEKKPYPEAPFLPFDYKNEHKEQWESIRTFYGTTDDFPADQLLVRSSTAGKITLVSKSIRRIFEVDDRKALKVVNCGVRVMNFQEMQGNTECRYRIAHQGIRFLLPFITKRTIKIKPNDLWNLLSHDDPFVSTFSEDVANAMSALSQGCVVLRLDPSSPKPFDGIAVAAYIAKVSCHCQVPKEDRASMIQLLKDYEDRLGISTGEKTASQVGADAEPKVDGENTEKKQE